jgi:hypothetical protein
VAFGDTTCSDASLLHPSAEKGELPAMSAVATERFDLPDRTGHVQLAIEGAPISRFLVPHGLGAPIGLNPLQHVNFSTTVKQPAGSPQVLDPDLQNAIEYIECECQHTVEEIDKFPPTAIAACLASRTGA